MVNLRDIVETRICKVSAFTLVGFQGQSMEEEKKLFQQLTERLNEITARKNDDPYLVVRGKFPTPYVAVEVSDISNVPEGMVAFTVPEREYVAFKFSRQHVGEFWANVCTDENQATYNIDLSKARFERFTPALQNTGLIEWYIPRHHPN